MIVQAINSGGDLSETQFDLMMAGGGMGIFNGLAKNGDEPVNPPNNPQPLFAEPYSVWGQRYGGVSRVGACNALPEVVQAGCQWRFADDGFMGADNPGKIHACVRACVRGSIDSDFCVCMRVRVRVQTSIMSASSVRRSSRTNPDASSSRTRNVMATAIDGSVPPGARARCYLSDGERRRTYRKPLTAAKWHSYKS